MIIEIGDKIISSEILKKEFVCDLHKCKGQCCIQGDDGAPLTLEETKVIEQEYKNIKPFLNQKGIDSIEKNGVFYLDSFNEPVTQLNHNKECSFVTYNEKGWAQCGIEQAYNQGKTTFKKPISCHLYPIRVKKFDSFLALNYHSWKICSSACELGKKLKLKVYHFLKEPIIRYFGEEFYNELKTIDLELEKQQIAINNKNL